jgi:Na+-driven multidrug efflux pump
LLQVAVIPLMALGAAAGVLAGQNFGAGLGRRVQETFRATLSLGLIITPLLCVALNLLSRSLSGVFSDDPAVVEGCSRFLQIVSFSLIPSSVVIAAFSVLAGLGNTRASLVTTTVYSILVVLPAWFMARLPGFRPEWLWELMVGMTVLEMLMALYFLRREFSRSVPVHAPGHVAGSLA